VNGTRLPEPEGVTSAVAVVAVFLAGGVEFPQSDPGVCEVSGLSCGQSPSVTTEGLLTN
jgi:hypothetical protein